MKILITSYKSIVIYGMTPKMKFLCQLTNTITDQEKGNTRLFLISTMELENRDFRAMIYYDLKRGLT